MRPKLGLPVTRGRVYRRPANEMSAHYASVLVRGHMLTTLHELDKTFRQDSIGMPCALDVVARRRIRAIGDLEELAEDVRWRRLPAVLRSPRRSSRTTRPERRRCRRRGLERPGARAADRP